jgi:hypothetical protein
LIFRPWLAKQEAQGASTLVAKRVAVGPGHGCRQLPHRRLDAFDSAQHQHHVMHQRFLVDDVD